MTLRQGLDEYYTKNPEFNGTDEFLGQPRDIVVAHDVCHVVFGLGGTAKEELQVEVVTLIGCVLPLKKVQEIPKVKLAKGLWKLFGPWRLVRRFVLTAPQMARIFFMAIRMKKKWPHFDYQKYMDVPLADIRKEFGIKIFAK